MMFKKSILNYLFKNPKNDQASVKLKDLVQSIDTKLTDEETVYLTKTNESLSLQEYKVETELERIEYLLSLVSKGVNVLDETVRVELVKLKLRLLNTDSLVKQALLSERKLTGETYTLQVPLTEGYYSKNTTATIKDEVIFGIGFNEENVTAKLDLSTLYIKSEENTDFKITSETNLYPIEIQLAENFYKPYNQLKLTVGSLSQTGILYIKFAKAEAISVLDMNGYEIIEPYVTDKISLNITAETKSFSIRFASPQKRVVTIKEMYFTEAVYNKTTVFETMPLAIDKDLSFLTVQTCDNYSNKDVSINYEISINSNPYRAFRPNGKLNNKKLQSIIKTGITDNTEVKLNYTTLQNGYYRYYNENLVNINSRLKIFSGKMGEDFLSLENFLPTTVEDVTLHIQSPRDFVLKLSQGMFIYIDDMYYEYDGVNLGSVKVEAGLCKIRVEKRFWKEIVDLDLYEVVSIEKEKLTVYERTDLGQTKIVVDNYFDTENIQHNSIYLQLKQNKCQVYLKEEENIGRKFDADYIEYFYKDDQQPLYVYSEAYQTTVDTIQIRVTLDAIDAKVCPYISKIIVRGV